MVRVRALSPFDGKRKGEEFDMPESLARILAAHDLPGGQKVEYVDRASVDTRAMRTEDSPLTTPGKGRYGRRDMRAKE